MSNISQFRIKNLHGYKTIDIKFSDNTLILVGENGAGKTTVLQLLYYLLSGQWSSMARYVFDEITLIVDSTKHVVRYSDIEKSILAIDRRILRRLPPTLRRRFNLLVEQGEGRLVTPELEILCREYDIPVTILLQELDMFEHAPSKQGKGLRETLSKIRDSFPWQLLYLPTYRRIEQELSLIFRGADERELRHRRELLTARRGGETFVELIEFGMKDVVEAIDHTLSELGGFARRNLNDLTFGYLGDIVERQYKDVDLQKVMGASEETVEKILNRIQEHVLSSQNKQHLRAIIEEVRKGEDQPEHNKMICHYFTKLMDFQEELEVKEAGIVNFCSVCNDYLVDKRFSYDNSNFTYAIQSIDGGENRKIELHQLSSGEKQIVSLFSHLYLSGGDDYFVLIDEPELSLSVPWQRKFLVDIRNAAFCKGLVAVTHSPFIYDNELKGYARGLGEFLV